MTSCEPIDEPRATLRFKHGVMPVVGLTGGIGSGKSEVTGMLARAGCRVIDADLLGHAVLEDPEVKSQLVDRFGSRILARDPMESGGPSRIDRSALAAIVFADPGARRDLEAIVHPLMRARFIESIGREGALGDPRPLVLDAAILLEAGWEDLCDLVVFVDAPRAVRMRRVADQRGWPATVFEAREQAQWPCEEKRRRAGIVVNNDGEIDSLRQEVDRLVGRLGDPSCWQVEAPFCCGAADALVQYPSRLAANASIGGTQDA
jgi:dephospho-CoA kinase